MNNYIFFENLGPTLESEQIITMEGYTGVGVVCIAKDEYMFAQFASVKCEHLRIFLETKDFVGR
jgi:hypothetical protein